MRDYDSTVKNLREAAKGLLFDAMPYRASVMRDAADAIEELLDELTTIRKQLPHWISVEANQKLPVSGLACTVGYFNGGKYGQLYWYGFVSKDENGVVVPHSTDIEGDCIAVYALPEPPKEVLFGGTQMSEYSNSSILSADIPIYDECERHDNCVVEVWRNSITGEVSVGWWENDNKPIGTKEGN